MKPNPRVTLLDPSAIPPQPPRPLGPHGMSLWRSVHSEFVITDIGGIETLCQACQTLDRAEDIAKEIAEDGVVINTVRGPRSHPTLKEELACRAFVVRTLERLGILHEPLNAQPGRQPDGRSSGILQPLRTSGITFLPPSFAEE